MDVSFLTGKSFFQNKKPIIIYAALLLLLLVLPIRMGDNGNSHIPVLGHIEKVARSYCTDQLPKVSAATAVTYAVSGVLYVLEEMSVPLINFAPGKIFISVREDIQRLGTALLLCTVMFLLGATIIDMVTFISFKLLVPVALSLRILYECQRETFAWAWKAGKPLAAGAILFWLYFPATALIGNYVQRAYFDGLIAAEMQAMEANTKRLDSIRDDSQQGITPEEEARAKAEQAKREAEAVAAEAKKDLEAANKLLIEANKVAESAVSEADSANRAADEAAAWAKAASGGTSKTQEAGILGRMLAEEDKGEAADRAKKAAAEATTKKEAAAAAAAKREAAATEAAAKAEVATKAEEAAAEAREILSALEPEKRWWSFESPTAKLQASLMRAFDYAKNTVSRLLRVFVMFLVTAVVIPVFVLVFFIKIFRILNPSIKQPLDTATS